MEVLRPTLVRIGGRCYRKNPTVQEEEPAPYQEEDEYEMDEEDPYEDEACDSCIFIEQTESGFRLPIKVPSHYFKYIIGRKGETRRRLEAETKTQIRIPRTGQEGDIIVTGRERKGVISAKTRIDLLVDSARQKQQFTHFISFPVAGDMFKERFLEFREHVLRQCDAARGIDKTIFQNPEKLHLTVGTLALMDSNEIERATSILQQCETELVRPLLGEAPLLVQFQGLEYMNDDPQEVDVMYAKLEPGDTADKLQMLADRLVDKFSSSGLMRKEYTRVKLHVTVMNTLMRKDSSGTFDERDRRGPIRDRESFDARELLHHFREYDFGVHHINTIHLSQRYSTSPSGYYATAASIDL